MKFLLVLFITFSHDLMARPEYANREKQRCISCHVSPYGSGARRSYGKVYANEEYEGSQTSDNELYFADFRTVYLKKTNISNSDKMDGFTVMMAALTANIPIVKQEKGFDTRIVLTHDLGTLAPGTREAYALFENTNNESLLSSIKIGKFISPFGLLTDDHRTYTKMLTMSSMREFEAGAVFSGEVTDSLHYDVAITNGFQNKGNFSSNDSTYAVVSNVQYMPETWPIFLGSSYSRHMAKKDRPLPWAYSLYFVIDGHTLTKEWLDMDFSFEYTQARYLNSSGHNTYISRFVDSSKLPNYASAIESSISNAIMAKALWSLTTNTELAYKYNMALPDNDFRDDQFSRHALWLRYRLNSNTYLTLRGDLTKVKRQGIKELGSWSVDNDVLLLLHVWL